MAKFDRSKMKKNLREAMNQDPDSKPEKKGGSDKAFKPYLDVPENMWQFNPMFEMKNTGKWDIYFDIIPFFAGDKYPTESSRGFENPPGDGDPAYYLKLALHKNVGPDNQRVICPKYNYGEDCPICEWYWEQKDKLDGDEEAEKKFYNEHGLMWRSVYFMKLNEIVADSGDNPFEDKWGKIHVFDFPHAWMENKLQNMKVRRDGTVCYYADPDEGMEVGFSLEKKGDRKYEVSSHQFYDRKNEITDEEMESLPPLDSMVILHSYEELQNIMNGDTPSDEEAEEKPSRREERSRPEPEEKQDDSKSHNPDCPAGMTFGDDCNAVEDCDTCDVYDDCLAEKRAKAKAKRENSSGGRRRPRGMEDDIPF